MQASVEGCRRTLAFARFQLRTSWQPTCQCTEQVEEAIQIFQDMVARNCERNVITYSSLISACEKAGRWQLALDLFHEMHRDSCKPNVVTYNALIAACGQGEAPVAWGTARELLYQQSVHSIAFSVLRFFLCPVA